MMHYFNLLFLMGYVNSISGFNILLFLIGTNQNERLTFEFLAQQLARRHHNVVTVKAILIPEEPRLVQPRLHLVREKIIKDILPKRLYQPLVSVGGDVPWRTTYEYDAFEEPYRKAFNFSCEKMLNSNLMEVLSKEQIDLAILDTSGNPCELGIVHTMGIPFIYYDVRGFTENTRRVAGVSEIPIFDVEFLDIPSLEEFLKMVEYFRNRIILKGRLICDWLSSEFDWLAVLFEKLGILSESVDLDRAIHRQFAKDYEIKRRFRGNFPPLHWIRKNAEFFFLNTDSLLESPSQQLPANVLHVGGLHIDTVKPLFSPWNDSIASSQLGVILVSFGTQVDTSKMPPELVRTLLSVFARFNSYRIFWKIGPKLRLPGIGDLRKLEDNVRVIKVDEKIFTKSGVEALFIPEHINITTFVPQNEVMASARTRLLITNGGAHSVMESIYHGVPIVGIPLYGTNRENLEKMKRKGLGLFINKQDLTERTLTKVMRRVLDDPSYASTAHDMSRELRRRPADAFERALHAIDHVARHRGARFFNNKQSRFAASRKFEGRSGRLLREMLASICWRDWDLLFGTLILSILFYVTIRIQFRWITRSLRALRTKKWFFYGNHIFLKNNKISSHNN